MQRVDGRETRNLRAGLTRSSTTMPSDRDAVRRLDRWALLVPSGRRHLATPDCPAVVLTGIVSGDAHFPNGAAVVTSCVLELDVAGAWARTRGGVNTLGAPSRLFVRWMRQHDCTLEAFARTAADAASRVSGIDACEPTTYREACD